MIYVLLFIFFMIMSYSPSCWVKYMFWRYSGEIEDMPGTGGELAQHFVERFELTGVIVEKGKQNENNYNPDKNIVSLSPDVYNGKSLTAVAVATHEIGHALQFNNNEPISELRKKYMSKAHLIKKIGVILLMSSPLVTVIARTPHMIIITAVIGIITMLSSVLMYVAILPEEYDASFNKALPILEEGYVQQENIPAIRQILRACALTYVTAAMADILNLWRWIRIFR